MRIASTCLVYPLYPTRCMHISVSCRVNESRLITYCRRRHIHTDTRMQRDTDTARESSGVFFAMQMTVLPH
jgi:hypothetical protein